MAYQGTYFNQPFTLRDVSGNAVNITGWTFKAELRAQVSDADPLVTLESGTGGFTIIDAANGRVAMSLTSAQTAALEVGVYLFDVLRTDANPGPIWLFGGKLKIKQPVTR